MTDNSTFQMYFLPSDMIDSTLSDDKRYLIVADQFELRTGDTIHFVDRNLCATISNLLLMLFKVSKTTKTEAGYRYLVDFDVDVGTMEASQNLRCKLVSRIDNKVLSD